MGGYFPKSHTGRLSLILRLDFVAAFSSLSGGFENSRGRPFGLDHLHNVRLHLLAGLEGTRSVSGRCGDGRASSHEPFQNRLTAVSLSDGLITS